MYINQNSVTQPNDKVNIVCPSCGKTLEIPFKYMGMTGRCNKCGHRFLADFDLRTASVSSNLIYLLSVLVSITILIGIGALLTAKSGTENSSGLTEDTSKLTVKIDDQKEHKEAEVVKSTNETKSTINTDSDNTQEAPTTLKRPQKAIETVQRIEHSFEGDTLRLKGHASVDRAAFFAAQEAAAQAETYQTRNRSTSSSSSLTAMELQNQDAARIVDKAIGSEIKRQYGSDSSTYQEWKAGSERLDALDRINTKPFKTEQEKKMLQQGYWNEMSEDAKNVFRRQGIGLD